MILSDFSTLVQLGVGLHSGTALFQSILDLGGGPLASRLTRLAKLAEAKAAKNHALAEQVEAAQDAMGDLESRRLLLEREFKGIVKFNAGVAALLVAALIIISFMPRSCVPWWVGAGLASLAVGPAAFSLAKLGRSWHSRMKPVRQSITSLEDALL